MNNIYALDKNKQFQTCYFPETSEGHPDAHPEWRGNFSALWAAATERS